MPAPAPGKIPEGTQGTIEPKPPLELLEHELDYRRTKEWNIFSWSSGILVAITGGMLVLQRSGPFPKTQRVPITIAVIVLTAYACIWLQNNENQKKRTADRITLDSLWNPRGDKYPPGYLGAVALLGVAALFAIWFPL